MDDSPPVTELKKLTIFIKKFNLKSQLARFPENISMRKHYDNRVSVPPSDELLSSGKVNLNKSVSYERIESIGNNSPSNSSNWPQLIYKYNDDIENELFNNYFVTRERYEVFSEMNIFLEEIEPSSLDLTVVKKDSISRLSDSSQKIVEQSKLDFRQNIHSFSFETKRKEYNRNTNSISSHKLSKKQKLLTMKVSKTAGGTLEIGRNKVSECSNNKKKNCKKRSGSS
ncbi:MAG: hypothetical protein MHPSP_000322 [Paramarteilia canceri]